MENCSSKNNKNKKQKEKNNEYEFRQKQLTVDGTKSMRPANKWSAKNSIKNIANINMRSYFRNWLALRYRMASLQNHTDRMLPYSVTNPTADTLIVPGFAEKKMIYFLYWLSIWCVADDIGVFMCARCARAFDKAANMINAFDKLHCRL